MYWMVTLNGVPLFKGLTDRKDAEAKAERWQGQRYRKGLLKHGDRGDHVEVKRDTSTERDFDERYQTWKDGTRQRIIQTEYIA